MYETIKFIIDFIRIDIFIGFGYFSIIYFLFRLFLRDKRFINEFDKSATQLVVFAGIVWGVLWLVGIFVFYFQLEDGIDQTKYVNRLIGKHSYGIWIQPLFWVLLTQLFRIKFIKKFLIFRIVISLLFVITFERFVIFVTSLHRDYLTNNWLNPVSFDLNLTTSQIVLGMFSKTLIFILTVFIFHFAERLLLKLKKKDVDLQ